MTKSNVGRKRFILAFSSQITLSPAEVRARTQGRNLGAGIEAVTMPKHCFLACFTQLAFIYTSGSPPTVIWVYPHQSSRKRPHRHASKVIWWKDFLNWGSFFPNDPNLCLGLEPAQISQAKNFKSILKCPKYGLLLCFQPSCVRYAIILDAKMRKYTW